MCLGVTMHFTSCGQVSAPTETETKAPDTDTSRSDPETGEMERVRIDLTEKPVTVVVASGALNAEMTAAQDLQSVLARMTGTKVGIQTDDTPSPEDHFTVYLGPVRTDEARALRDSVDELSYVISIRETCAYVLGTSGRITAFASEIFKDQFLHYIKSASYPLGELILESGETRTGSYYEATALGRILKYRKADNGCENRPETGVEPGIPPLAETPPAETEPGPVRTVSKDGSCGAPQFILKLFTEGLSRTPTPEEYTAYTERIELDGFSRDTLSGLAFSLFSGREYQDLGLSRPESVFTVYRAVLSRDPTEAELNDPGFADAASFAQSLCLSEEFGNLLDRIRQGPYYWYANNRTGYTGATVLTASQLQAMLNRDKHVELDPGTLVLVDRTVEIPEKGSLTTKGSPDHYVRMARLIRTGAPDSDMVHVLTGARIEYVFVDGNFRYTDERIAGSNIVMTGNGGTLAHCRCSDAGCTYTLNVLVGTEFNYVGYNLVTCYSSDHNRTWTDGIRSMGTDGIVEFNRIVDATDAALALFRYITHIENEPNASTYLRAQNSIVRCNTIIQAGNSSYAMLDFESNNINWNDAYLKGTTLNIPENPANFTGCVMYENSLWTSWLAHTHVAITMSTQPWTLIGQTDRVFGGSVCNNYTPENCVILCGSGICADGNTDAMIKGNRLHLMLGGWCNGLEHVPYRIDHTDSSGTFQAGYRNVPSSGTSSTLIASNLPIETSGSYTVEEAWIYEAPFAIPAERFKEK